jgi:hypothetical protein
VGTGVVGDDECRHLHVFALEVRQQAQRVAFVFRGDTVVACSTNKGDNT